MTASERKRMLRQELLARRRSAKAHLLRHQDAALANLLYTLPEYTNAEVLLTYLSFGREVDTRGIIRRAWEDEKHVAIPRCIPGTRTMRWHRITSFSDLVRSKQGVEEPQPDMHAEQLLNTGQPTLALVPGLTFDTSCHRLGYGGGYYDTFLAEFSGVSAGLCREDYMSVDLTEDGVIEAHDRPVQLVVTNKRIIDKWTER